MTRPLESIRNGPFRIAHSEWEARCRVYLGGSPIPCFQYFGEAPGAAGPAPGTPTVGLALNGVEHHNPPQPVRRIAAPQAPVPVGGRRTISFPPSAAASSRATRYRRPTGFQDEHVSKFGLRVQERFAGSKPVKGHSNEIFVFQRLGSSFGREDQPPSGTRKRNQPSTIKCFTPSFRTDHFRHHLESQYPSKWSQYQDLAVSLVTWTSIVFATDLSPSVMIHDSSFMTCVARSPSPGSLNHPPLLCAPPS